MYYVCFSKPEAKAIIEKAKTFDGWTTIKMNNEIEFQIPPNLEIQDAKYKSLAKTANPNLYALSILNGDNEIVVQQKGLNSLNKEAFKHFVRAIIDIKDSLEELPAYGDSLILTDKELKDFTEKYINETHYIEKAFVEAEAKHRSYKLLTVNSPFKVTKVNGVDCLYIAYDSQFSNEPIFKCEKYIFYNRKKVYTLTTMVRSTEYELWTTGNTDVRNIVKTFHLIKNTPLQNNGVNKNTDSVLQPKPKELTKDNITAIPNRINIVAVDAPGYILGDDVNIRTMPGTDSQIIGRVQRGFRLHIISYEDGWAKVEDTKGNVGYVAKQYISTNGTDVDWSKGDKYGKSAYSGVVKATDVNMRESNSINSRVIGTFQQGEHVKVLGFYKEWVKVQRNNGQVGYIMRSYLGY